MFRNRRVLEHAAPKSTLTPGTKRASSISDVASSLVQSSTENEVRWVMLIVSGERDCSSGLTGPVLQVEWEIAADFNQLCLVVGMNRHSNRHPSEEGQVAFKVLMTHGLRVA